MTEREARQAESEFRRAQRDSRMEGVSRLVRMGQTLKDACSAMATSPGTYVRWLNRKGTA
jgi:hypothetical protein